MTLEDIALDNEEIVRYSRQLLLPEVGVAGQKKLKKAKALIVGAGGLGSPIALYLAAAGIGSLGIVDRDRVEPSNLQRQIVHSMDDLNRLKAESARERLLAINPKIKVTAYPESLSKDNALEIIKGYDLILDGTDNFPTRYLLNDAAYFLGLPMIYGSVFRFEGQASVFWAKKGPCYRCLFPAKTAPTLALSCGEAGIMGAVPGIIGAIQATEAIKLVLGGGQSLIGRILLLDAFTMEFNVVEVEKDPECPLCGNNPVIDELIDYEEFFGPNIPEALAAESLSPKELSERLKSGPPIQIIDITEERGPRLFPSAIAVNFVDLEKILANLNPLIDAIVICKIGQRSLFAIRKLKKAGYKGRLFYLKDGLNALRLWA
jgi:adenylyltransferase/sulfurtransferase